MPFQLKWNKIHQEIGLVMFLVTTATVRKRKNRSQHGANKTTQNGKNMALFSDSVADLPSFKRVGLPIAVQPKLELRRSMARFGIIPLRDALKKF